MSFVGVVVVDGILTRYGFLVQNFGLFHGIQHGGHHGVGLFFHDLIAVADELLVVLVVDFEVGCGVGCRF